MRIGRSRDNKDREEARLEEAARQVEALEHAISRQEDILYGVALFFEGLSLLHEDDQAVVETYRKQFRNIIENGQVQVREASKLAGAARKNPGKARLIKDFRFAVCAAHPRPADLEARSVALAENYNRIFPDRSRSKPFSREETLQLLSTVTDAQTTAWSTSSSPLVG